MVNKITWSLEIRICDLEARDLKSTIWQQDQKLKPNLDDLVLMTTVSCVEAGLMVPRS